MDRLPLPRSAPQIATGFRRVGTPGLSLGDYAIGQRSPGQVFASPKVSPQAVDRSKLDQLSALNKALVGGSLAVGKILETTKAWADREDAEAINTFVSGLTADEALKWTKAGQAALDQAVRQGKLAGLQNPENFNRLWQATGDRAAPAIFAKVRQNPDLREAAVDGILDPTDKQTPAEFLSVAVNALIGDVDEDVRAGILGSRTYQALEAQWLDEVYSKANKALEEGLVESGTALVAQGASDGSPALIRQGLETVSGTSNARENQLKVLTSGVLAIAESDPDTAVARLEELFSEDSGIVIGGVPLSSDGMARTRMNLRAATLDAINLKEQATKTKEADLKKLVDTEVARARLEFASPSLSESDLEKARDALLESAPTKFEDPVDQELYVRAVWNAYDTQVSRLVARSERDYREAQRAEEEVLADIPSLTEEFWQADDKEGYLVDLTERIEDMPAGRAKTQMYSLLSSLRGIPMESQLQAANTISQLTSAFRQANKAELAEQYKFTGVPPEVARQKQEEALNYQIALQEAAGSFVPPNGVFDQAALTKHLREASRAFLGDSGEPERKLSATTAKVEELRKAREAKSEFSINRRYEELGNLREAFNASTRPYSTKSLEIMRNHTRAVREYLKEWDGRAINFQDFNPLGAVTEALLPSLSEIGQADVRAKTWRSLAGSPDGVKALAATADLLRGMTAWVGEPRAGLAPSTRGRRMVLEENSVDAARVAYNEARTVLLPLTSQELSSRVDRFGIDLPRDLNPELQAILDLTQVKTREDLLRQAKSKAGHLGVTPEELVAAQSVFWGRLLMPTPEEAAGFDLMLMYR